MGYRISTIIVAAWGRQPSAGQTHSVARMLRQKMEEIRRVLLNPLNIFEITYDKKVGQ